jgi:hypothetical protein
MVPVLLFPMVVAPSWVSCGNPAHEPSVHGKDLGRIALQHLREQGIGEDQLQCLVPEWDDNNSLWRHYAESDGPLSWDFDPELGVRLEGARYWAVCLGPNEEQCSGGFWVFVCKDDLHVIGWFGGE